MFLHESRKLGLRIRTGKLKVYHLTVNPLAESSREVVYDYYFMSGLFREPHNVGSDVASTTSYEKFHG
jgi:hypothetical protein